MSPNKKQKLFNENLLIENLLSNYLLLNKKYYTTIFNYLPCILSSKNMFNRVSSPDYSKNSYFLIINDILVNLRVLQYKGLLDKNHKGQLEYAIKYLQKIQKTNLVLGHKEYGKIVKLMDDTFLKIDLKKTNKNNGINKIFSDKNLEDFKKDTENLIDSFFKRPLDVVTFHRTCVNELLKKKEINFQKKLFNKIFRTYKKTYKINILYNLNKYKLEYPDVKLSIDEVIGKYYKDVTFNSPITVEQDSSSDSDVEYIGVIQNSIPNPDNSSITVSNNNLNFNVSDNALPNLDNDLNSNLFDNALPNLDNDLISNVSDDILSSIDTELIFSQIISSQGLDNCSDIISTFL